MKKTFNIVVFISGTGSNLDSIIKNQSKYDYNVTLVVSNNENATGLNFARDNDIPVYTFKWDRADKELQHLQSKIDAVNCDLVVLAGFMRILPEIFINKYTNKIINIHPSLLPKYPGLHTHKRALENKDSHHGATVHYVNTELDGGIAISQYPVSIENNDDIDSLSSRLLTKEHKLFPYTIGLIRENRVEWRKNHLYFDGKQLKHPIILHD
jgi:phosphoribosylglycinamide formyltransferase-1